MEIIKTQTEINELENKNINFKNCGSLGRREQQNKYTTSQTDQEKNEKNYKLPKSGKK